MGGTTVSESSLHAASWIEPDTHHEYPTSYLAYRRAREAQERTPARHCGLGPHVDRLLSRHWRDRAESDIDVVLTFRPDSPPRVRRIVAEVLRAIRRGRPADDAIRRVARRFGLRQARARAFITAGIDYELRARQDLTAPISGAAWPSSTQLADWR
jgi:hypothetical protein